jgi:hypothetical protein
MNSFLERFQSQHKGRKTSVDLELVQKWEWDARANGDKHIKVEIAKAKRTATALEKSISQFCNLKASHEKSIRDAAKAMRELASELAALAAWAREYHAFWSAEWKRQEAEEVEAFAASRWPEPSAMAFEKAVLEELSSSEGRLAFAAWCHANNRHTDCALGEVSPPIDYLQRAPTVREALVKTVQQGMDRRLPNKWIGLRGMTVVCSWSDYEAYLVYRRGVASATAKLLQAVGNHS